MAFDVRSIFWFLLMYFLLHLIEYVISLMSNAVDLLSAIMVLKVNDIQSKCNSEEESPKENSKTQCIGFQYEETNDGEDEDDV